MYPCTRTHVHLDGLLPCIPGNIRITGAPIKVWDSHRKKWRSVFPVLVFAYADTPARRGWALTTGHTGRSGCDKCGIRGIRILPGGIQLNWTAFAGFHHPCPAMVFYPQPKVSLFSPSLTVSCSVASPVHVALRHVPLRHATNTPFSCCRNGSKRTSSSGLMVYPILLLWRRF